VVGADYWNKKQNKSYRTLDFCYEMISIISFNQKADIAHSAYSYSDLKKEGSLVVV